MKQQPLCKVCRREQVTAKREYACGPCWNGMSEADKKILKSGRESLSLRTSNASASVGMGAGKVQSREVRTPVVQKTMAATA